MFSLFLLFLGILMTTVPLHVQNLSSYIISSNHLDLSPVTQQSILSLLSHTFVTDVGRFLLGISSFLLLPSTLGYVGAVRESRFLLILVRMWFNLMLYINLAMLKVLHTPYSALGTEACLPDSTSCIQVHLLQHCFLGGKAVSNLLQRRLE